MSHHYGVIVVDYLQKIPAVRGGRPLSEFERVSQVSSDLQQLGRRTGMTVIALSQLSRAEKRRDGSILPPTMSSLRQSGQIEQDADVILLLWKEHPDAAQLVVRVDEQHTLPVEQGENGRQVDRCHAFADSTLQIHDADGFHFLSSLSNGVGPPA